MSFRNSSRACRQAKNRTVSSALRQQPTKRSNLLPKPNNNQSCRSSPNGPLLRPAHRYSGPFRTPNRVGPQIPRQRRLQRYCLAQCWCKMDHSTPGCELANTLSNQPLQFPRPSPRTRQSSTQSATPNLESVKDGPLDDMSTSTPPAIAISIAARRTHFSARHRPFWLLFG